MAECERVAVRCMLFAIAWYIRLANVGAKDEEEKQEEEEEKEGEREEEEKEKKTDPTRIIFKLDLYKRGYN